MFRKIFYGFFISFVLMFSEAHAVVLQPENILVVNHVFGSNMLYVDYMSGQQSLVSSGQFFLGVNPLDVAVELAGTIITTGLSSGSGNTTKVIRVDPSTGSQTVVSTGGFLNHGGIVGIAIETDGNILITTFSNTRALVRINPITGAQSVVATFDPQDLYDLVLEKDGDIIAITTNPYSIMRVDPITGAKEIVSGQGLMKRPWGLTIGQDGIIYVADRKVVIDPDPGQIIAINPVTGVQSLVTHTPIINDPTRIDINDVGQLIVVDESYMFDPETQTVGAIFRVDIPSSTSALISSGDQFRQLLGVTVVKAKCNDGFDNDGDGLVDFPEDVGCPHPAIDKENPACQDGIDNDGDTFIDYDGGGLL